MVEEDVLDHFEQIDSRLIQESLEYRILLALGWSLWAVWSFYNGTIILNYVIEGPQGLLPLLSYNIATVYEDYFITILSLGMVFIIIKESKNRVFYLFSFIGIELFLWEGIIIGTGTLLVFLPMIILLFLSSFRACLICCGFSYLLLFVLTLNGTFSHLMLYFTDPVFFLFNGLIFMTAFSHRRLFFPLKGRIIKLRYRLFTLLGFLPLLLTYFFN